MLSIGNQTIKILIKDIETILERATLDDSLKSKNAVRRIKQLLKRIKRKIEK